MNKLINRIQGLCLFISSLPGSALRRHVESLSKPPDVIKHSQALPGKLDIKDTHLLFSISRQASQCRQAFSKHCLVKLISKDTHLIFSISPHASRCQQAFSKPCLVNLISKDTHLVFSISRYFAMSKSILLPCLVSLISKDTHQVSPIS